MHCKGVRIVLVVRVLVSDSRICITSTRQHVQRQEERIVLLSTVCTHFLVIFWKYQFILFCFDRLSDSVVIEHFKLSVYHIGFIGFTPLMGKNRWRTIVPKKSMITMADRSCLKFNCYILAINQS